MTSSASFRIVCNNMNHGFYLCDRIDGSPAMTWAVIPAPRKSMRIVSAIVNARRAIAANTEVLTTKTVMLTALLTILRAGRERALLRWS